MAERGPVHPLPLSQQAAAVFAATVRRVFRLPQFDERDGISGGVDHLIRLSAPRADAPLKLSDAKPSAVAIAAPRPDAALFDGPAGLQAATFHSALAQHLQLTPVEQHDAIVARVRLLKRRAEGLAYLTEVEQLVREQRAQKRIRSSI